jgi:hypothetical protein
LLSNRSKSAVILLSKVPGAFKSIPIQEVPVKKYCKAYSLAEVRRFPGWPTRAQPEEKEMSDEAMVFLTDEFTVIISPVGKDKDKVLFAEDTPEWRKFCTKNLKFKIPEDLAFAYADSGES